jgi:hypothetical protein
VRGDGWGERRSFGRMTRRLKPSAAAAPPSEGAADASAVLQVKAWLVSISPMVWRRILVPTANPRSGSACRTGQNARNVRI